MKTLRRHTKPRVETLSFELPINGRTFAVDATPYIVATGDTLYRISYNKGSVHIFGWDEGLNRFAETDNMADIIPPVIEMAIAERLHDFSAQMQHAA